MNRLVGRLVAWSGIDKTAAEDALAFSLSFLFQEGRFNHIQTPAGLAPAARAVVREVSSNRRSKIGNSVGFSAIGAGPGSSQFI